MDNKPIRYGILESILQDPSAKPRTLPLQELKEVTNNFSEDRQLGKGGFGIVYKGQLPNGEAVAVKDLILSQFQFQEKQFKREVDNLMKVQHQNIVRFLGYCYESSHEYVQYKTTHVFAESSKMLLCFEYVSNGSLEKHINDESCGFDWHKRYKIIKGICHGLHYLHEECPHGSIIHLDLKPENILLDHGMVPKIADFGISKFFSDQKFETCATSPIGSRGYMAPEYFLTKTVSKMADIYSLGVIIMQIITGRWVDETSYEDIVESVLENWSKRMKAKTSVTDCEQIRICLKIGIQCMEFKKEKRPSIKEILQQLYTLEDINNGYTNNKETYKEVSETVRREGTAEEIVARVGGMVPAALDAVKAATGSFPELWKSIAATLEKLPACLPNPSSQLDNNNALCRNVLQSVADTLAGVTDIAGRCREPPTAGKLQMQSVIDAVAVQVDDSLRDCELLAKIASSPPHDDEELQRIFAWMEMSHTEAKNLGLDRLLEALNKDAERVVSMLGRENVSAVVQLLTASWPEAVRNKAATVVCYVWSYDRTLLDLEDAVPPLIRLLESGSLVGRQMAALTLHQLSSKSESTAYLIESHGGVRPLIEMCRRNNKGVDSVSQSAAAGTLNNISAAPNFRQSLAKHGIVSVMVDLLDCGDAVPASKDHAAECLKNFTSRANDNGLRRDVVSEGGLRALLLYYLGDKHDRHEIAVIAIRNLVGVISTTSGSAGDKTTMKRLAGEQGCVPLLVRTMVQEDNSKSAREVAVEMLASLATYPPNAMEMSEDDKCVPALLHLLVESGSPVCRQKAALTLHHVSSTSNSAASVVVALGGVRPLIEMCRRNHKEGGDSVSQSAAAGTLKNISAAPHVRLLLAGRGIVRVMVDLLHCSDALPETKEHAAQCLKNLTTSGDNDDGLRRDVLSEGGLRALLIYVSDNDDRHVAAVNAIRNLVDAISTTSGSAGDSIKCLVGEQGCVPLLARTMQVAKTDTAREVAVQALASLATYPPNAREMDADDMCVADLVQRLDPTANTNTANKHAVQCLLLLESTKRWRKLMISHGAKRYLKKLTDMDVQGATELLQRLERGSRLRSLFSGSSNQ